MLIDCIEDYAIQWLCVQLVAAGMVLYWYTYIVRRVEFHWAVTVIMNSAAFDYKFGVWTYWNLTLDDCGLNISCCLHFVNLFAFE